LIQKLKQFLFSDLSKGGLLILALRLIGLLIYFIFNIYISNTFGAAVYGDFIIYLLCINILVLVSLLGFDGYILQNFSALIKNQEWSKLRGLDRKIQNTLIGNWVILFAICAFIAYSFQNIFHDVYISYLICFGLGPMLVYRYRLECLRAAQSMKEYGILAFIILPGTALLALISLKPFYKSLAPFLAYSIALFVVAIVCLLFWKRKMKGKRSSPAEQSKNTALLKYAIPFMFIGALMFFNDWVDKMMLRSLSGTYEVGLYSAAFRLVQFGLLPLLSINTLAAPKLANAFEEKGNQNLKRLFQSVSSIILIASIPILIVIALASNFLLSLFGAEFQIAQTCLLILLIGTAFNILAGPVGIFLKMTKKQNILMWITLVSVVLNVLLNFLLIPKFGIEGAAIATTSSIILINALSLIYIKKNFGYLPYKIKFS